jgi:4-amino-4-deoxy-L-arabinose transferase-like glycosyltransferase
MEWPFRKEALDNFWRTLEAQAQPSESAARFPILSRPAVHVTLLVLLTLAFCLGSLAVNKTLEGDEALYALIPKTIAMTGEWIHLTYNGEPYFFKPPLNFWLSAAIFHVFPITAFSASLGSALFGAFNALMIYVLCRAMFPGWEMAFLSALVFLTTHEALHWTRGVHLESMVTFWILVGLYAAYRSMKNPAAIVVMGIAAALGWLSKGPHSLYPALAALPLWKSEGILWRRLVSIWSVLASVALIAILAPWFWLRMHEGTGFGQGYFLKEMGHTLFGPTQLHNGPLFYPAKLVVTYWPWLPAAVIGFFLLARGWLNFVGARLWLVYAAFVFVVILITAERRMRYLFPLYPALSVASGAAVAFAAQRHPRLLRIFVALAAIGATVMIVVSRKGTNPPSATREAVMTAGQIRPGERVWITYRTQNAGKTQPSVGKILGFYAESLLYACKSDCRQEAGTGSTVVARPDEAEQVAKAVNGKIDYSNNTLAIVRMPGGDSDGGAKTTSRSAAFDGQSNDQVK